MTLTFAAVLANADIDWYDEREFGMGDRFEGDVLQ